MPFFVPGDITDIAHLVTMIDAAFHSGVVVITPDTHTGLAGTKLTNIFIDEIDFAVNPELERAAKHIEEIEAEHRRYYASIQHDPMVIALRDAHREPVPRLPPRQHSHPRSPKETRRAQRRGGRR
jgi:hypothetical protein